MSSDIKKTSSFTSLDSGVGSLNRTSAELAAAFCATATISDTIPEAPASPTSPTSPHARLSAPITFHSPPITATLTLDSPPRSPTFSPRSLHSQNSPISPQEFSSLSSLPDHRLLMIKNARRFSAADPRIQKLALERKASATSTCSITGAGRSRSPSVVEAKEKYVKSLEVELRKKEHDLELQSGEMASLRKVMDDEIDELTSSLFEEANRQVMEAMEEAENSKMQEDEAVQEAAVARKQLADAERTIEVLQEQVEAFKQITRLSTPSCPNPEFKRRTSDEKKESKFTQLLKRADKKLSSGSSSNNLKALEVAANHHTRSLPSNVADSAATMRATEVDTVLYHDLTIWLNDPKLDWTRPLLATLHSHDLVPTLLIRLSSPTNQFAAAVKDAMSSNQLYMDPLPIPSTQHCQLCDETQLCCHTLRVGDSAAPVYICSHGRARVATAGELVTFLRHAAGGLFRRRDAGDHVAARRCSSQAGLCHTAIRIKTIGRRCKNHSRCY